MKAKLIKTDKSEIGYILSIDAADLSDKLPDNCKLSKKNCDEIFKVKQWDRTCLDCNKGFNFEQMIPNHKCCPYCEGVNYAGVFYEQPTEVEVMIVMEEINGEINGGTYKVGKRYQPKLDSEGCLILKKI